MWPASFLCHRHHHVLVRYFDTTKIKGWCMSYILINMTYFSVYTICISEHYRVIVSYIPTPLQQVSAILWSITITVWLQSQIYCVTFFNWNFVTRFFMQKFYYYTALIIIFGFCRKISRSFKNQEQNNFDLILQCSFLYWVFPKQ